MPSSHHYVAAHDANGAILWRWGINSDGQAERPTYVTVDGVKVWSEIDEALRPQSQARVEAVRGALHDPSAGHADPGEELARTRAKPEPEALYDPSTAVDLLDALERAVERARQDRQGEN